MSYRKLFKFLLLFCFSILVSGCAVNRFKSTGASAQLRRIDSLAVKFDRQLPKQILVMRQGNLGALIRPRDVIEANESTVALAEILAHGLNTSLSEIASERKLSIVSWQKRG
jgi:hypothetical protein